MREEICRRQNSDWSLDRLAAQRFLYGKAKLVEGLRLGLIVVVGALLLVGLMVRAESFSEWATMAVVLLWFIDQIALVPWAARKREEAAAVQEDFDCCVLDIAWPEQLGVARPTGDRVRTLANKVQGAAARKGLADWYGVEDMPVEPVAARLHCQRMNCHWDSSLRGEWIRVVGLTVSALAVAVVGVGLAMDITLLEVLLGVAAGIRLLAWLLLEQRAHSAAEKRMKNLHGYLSRAEADGGPASMSEVRLVQAAIFEHRRGCPSVPDWFYWVRRKAYEGKAEV